LRPEHHADADRLFCVYPDFGTLHLDNVSLWPNSQAHVHRGGIAEENDPRHFDRTEAIGRDLHLVIAWNQGARIQRSRRICGEFNNLPRGSIRDLYFGTADHRVGGISHCPYDAAGAHRRLGKQRVSKRFRGGGRSPLPFNLSNGVQGVLDEQQIENLPVNGRNFLDLAQLEPGVQIQDAVNFSNGKDGFSSISFGGRFGRTARIEVDGLDVSDEIFGSTTMNIPASGIQEFQLSQSSMDLSTELTTSGSINVTTRSGSNAVHGEAFGFFRDSSLAAALPAPPGLSEPFQRSQYGARLGGPIIKDKLFYFLDGERTLQHEQAPVLVAAPFQQYSGDFSSPFRENNLMARLDCQFGEFVHAFYRFSYFQNSFTSNGSLGYSVYDGKNITRTQIGGLDFHTGTWSHSIRFGYLKTERNLSDATVGSRLPLANYALIIQMGNTGLMTGPNGIAPATILQSDLQFKYDGSKIWGRHIIRYGVNFNRIMAAGFVPGQSLAPYVFTNVGAPEEAFAQTGPFPGGDTNPLNYPVETVAVGNALGYVTPFPGLGLPAGSYSYHRFALYLGASSKWKRSLTFTYGMRYTHESGRSDMNQGVATVNFQRYRS
jgi:hypothetical protein